MVMCSEPVMRAPFSGLLLAVLLAERHQAGHLDLGELDLLAAESRGPQTGDRCEWRTMRRSSAGDIARCGIDIVPFHPFIRMKE
jgi:hypothetical protein